MEWPFDGRCDSLEQAERGIGVRRLGQRGGGGASERSEIQVVLDYVVAEIFDGQRSVLKLGQERVNGDRLPYRGCQTP